MIKLDKKDQYKHISAGIALGLIMNDESQIPADKLKVEFAFTDAWRTWAHKQHFPWMTDIASYKKKDLDVIHIITYLNERTRVPYLGYFWDSEAAPGPTLYLHENTGFDPDDASDIDHAAKIIGEDQRIPATAWKDLAYRFLESLDPATEG
ncbi:hypothetical protein ACT3TP_03050 [Glutamicibacter sp. AOP38-B1-38]|uniref:hypothetical protein n=1 Tax=Glutamicibacter sp. AOP38-B1-38 TaxID=3457680 RepID=UPI004034E8BD